MKKIFFQIILIVTFSHFRIVIFSQNVGIGTLIPGGKLHVKGSADVSQLIIDANSTQSNLSPLIKIRKNDGTDLMWIHSDDSSNVFLGLKAGRANIVGPQGVNNTFLGSRTGYSNTNGRDNTVVGTNAFYSNTKASQNTAIGVNALFTQSFSPGGAFWLSNNVAVGYEALYYNQPINGSTGVNNMAIGTGALRQNTGGSQNTANGTLSLQTNTTGSKNTAVGYNADVLIGNLTNATAIGYNAQVGASNSLVLGGTGTDAVNVGIGTTNPTAKLEVVGTLKVVDGTQGAGKILTSNATGLASWQPPLSPSPTYYPSVTICCQSWMTKNLDVDTYRNGDPIPKVTDNAAWAALTTGAYCYYNNDSTMYAATYGKLYNWYAVNDSRGLAPVGWHIATYFEWTTLGTCLGGNAIAGGPMKEIGITHWNTPNYGATNLSGFTGLPGSFRYDDGLFNTVGDFGFWWSSTEDSSGRIGTLYLRKDDESLGGSLDFKACGMSVRCLRD